MCLDAPSCAAARPDGSRVAGAARTKRVACPPAGAERPKWGDRVRVRLAADESLDENALVAALLVDCAAGTSTSSTC